MYRIHRSDNVKPLIQTKQPEKIRNRDLQTWQGIVRQALRRFVPIGKSEVDPEVMHEAIRYWKKNNYGVSSEDTILGMLEFLLLCGADVHGQHAKNPNEYSPLFDSIDFYSKGLHRIQNLGAYVAIFLIQHGANVNERYENTGDRPLIYAAERYETGIAQTLVNHGADVNVANNDGYTPLHWAVRNGDEELVEFLLNKGANVNAATADNQTPLDFAMQFPNDKCIKTLTQYGGKNFD